MYWNRLVRKRPNAQLMPSMASSLNFYQKTSSVLATRYPCLHAECDYPALHCISASCSICIHSVMVIIQGKKDEPRRKFAANDTSRTIISSSITFARRSRQWDWRTTATLIAPHARTHAHQAGLARRIAKCRLWYTRMPGRCHWTMQPPLDDPLACSPVGAVAAVVAATGPDAGSAAGATTAGLLAGAGDPAAAAIAAADAAGGLSVV